MVAEAKFADVPAVDIVVDAMVGPAEGAEDPENDVLFVTTSKLADGQTIGVEGLARVAIHLETHETARKLELEGRFGVGHIQQIAAGEQEVVAVATD
mmetsp:Transcript_25517/g.43398  ORF Transcript_25517/g.43398 Transcript_25517/m.43398 type:complete len:97 (+) Transcript_25517:719-1009(+)